MEEVVTYTSGDISSPPDLRLLHFNDGEGDFFNDFPQASITHGANLGTVQSTIWIPPQLNQWVALPAFKPSSTTTAVVSNSKDSQN